MKQYKIDRNLRTCIVCEGQLYGRSDKVFCDIQCKNRYHAELARSKKTIANETFKILGKNWAILASLMSASADELHINKVELARHGFDFTAVSGVDVTTNNIHFDVFEYTWYYRANQEIAIILNKKQTTISPFLFKRWRYRYSYDDFPSNLADTSKLYTTRNTY